MILGLLCDILWADPDKETRGWGENDRGVSFVFGVDVVEKFLHRHDLDLICRAHQVVEDGYEFFAQRRLVTLFSAPNYCGEFDNAGGMMSVDETLMCSFQVSERFSVIWCFLNVIAIQDLCRLWTCFIAKKVNVMKKRMSQFQRTFKTNEHFANRLRLAQVYMLR